MASRTSKGDDNGFSGARAAEIVGISYRQLDYWARTDLVRPSVTDATGSGSRRQYSYGDLLELKVIKSMLDAGIMLPPSQFEAWFLSSAHTEGDIDATLDAARTALLALALP